MLPDCGASFAVDETFQKLELGDSIACTSAEAALLVSFGGSNFHQALKENLVCQIGRERHRVTNVWWQEQLLQKIRCLRCM